MRDSLCPINIIPFRIKLIFLLLVIFTHPNVLNCQKTIIKGKVIDSDNSEGIPFVNVFIRGTGIGTTSDTTGLYSLSTVYAVDSVFFTAIGYLPKGYPVESGMINNIQAALIPNNIQLNSINVKPDDGPVRRLLKNIVEHKKENNPERLDRFEYDKYTRWQYRLNNVGEKLVQSKTFKKNPSLIKADSTNTRFLPVYFSEQMVHNEFQRDPIKQKSTIIADKTSGLGMLKDYEISGYTSGLDIEVNFYNNFINLFMQNFASPINDNGWFYYKYYLVDSAMVDGVQQYKVKFVPRRMGDKVFKGFFTVETRNYALLDIDATLSDVSHINFMKDLRLVSSYQVVEDSLPFYKMNLIESVFDYIPINTSKNANRLEIAFSQKSLIDSVKVGHLAPVELSSKGLMYESVKLPASYHRDSLFWEQYRPDSLSVNEKMMYSVIDSVNQISTIKMIDRLGRMYMTGYFDIGKLELGPYDYSFNFNEVEGIHLFLGARTSNEISEQWMIWGGVGYGTKNEEFLGRFGAGYKFDTSKRRVLKFSYSDDIIRIGEQEKILYLYENMLSPSETNLLANMFQRDTLTELIRQQKVAFSYEHEWKPGFSTRWSTSYNKQYSPVFYPFIYKGQPLNFFQSYETNLNFRWSWKEKYIDDGFLRVYYSTDFPIVNFSLGLGRYNLPDREDFYGKIHATIKHNIYMRQTYLMYALEGGMYFGTIPYSLLDIPRGNETYGYYTYDFNLIDYLEFVHDKYLHAYFEYHLNGFFFNRMPLLRRLGLREVISAKGMMGHLSDKQYQLIDLPSTMSPENNKLYLEVGAGIENILRFFRLEAIYRVTHHNSVAAPQFGIRAKFEIKL